VLAPLLLLAGLWTRAAGLLVAINMVVAVLLVHTDQLAALNRNGGWALELQGFYFFIAVAMECNRPLGVVSRPSLTGQERTFESYWIISSARDRGDWRIVRSRALQAQVNQVSA
jgi:hypothetical protein